METAGTAAPASRGTPARAPRRRRAVWAVPAAALLLGGVAAGAMRPPALLREGPRTVEIPPRIGLWSTARLLHAEGVVRSPVVFVALAILRGTARSLKAGEYEVPRDADVLAVLALLERGRVKPHVVVLPEGFTVRDLARILEAEGLATGADVLAAAADPTVARALGVEAPGLEGYLFPDTYHLTRGMPVEEILGRMVQRFRERVATPEVLDRARARGLTLHELVTLASIIERETALPEERPVIAGVFWNRLQRDMPLQADPTVAYAVGRDGAPTRQDLAVDHPFNTYRHRGLPPGPIANPGLAAIRAALWPASVPYLYFVAVDDRQHHFSVTFEEHQRAVARYRQQRNRPGA